MHILQQFLPAKLHEGKSWFVSYYAYNPVSQKLERKRIKLNRIKPVSERRKFARELINNINQKLYSGWNPFIDPEAKKSYSKISQAVEHFLKIAQKKLSDDVIREETFRDYVSYPKNFLKWLEQKKRGDIYVFEMDRKIIIDFLEHIYIERNNSATTRNNYLNFFRVFSGFLIDNGYLKHKPTEGISTIRRNKKKRQPLKKEDLEKLRLFLYSKNKYYLLACEIEYYMFIRPKELSHVKIGDIDFEKRIIIVNEEVAKNRTTATITIPQKLYGLMIELKLKEYKPSYYLFSENFKPGKTHKSEKTFRDYWLNVIRKELKFPDFYQFYSLKDTGIIEMIKQVGSSVAVRDQARHHSIAITDKYAHGVLDKANQDIRNLDY